MDRMDGGGRRRVGRGRERERGGGRAEGWNEEQKKKKYDRRVKERKVVVARMRWRLEVEGMIYCT